jgi:hypothetical protein
MVVFDDPTFWGADDAGRTGVRPSGLPEGAIPVLDRAGHE